MSDNKRKNEWVEEIQVQGNDLVAKVKELIEQGNVRRLVIRKNNGDVLMEFPLTASVIAGSAMLVFTPLFAALGALAAFVAEVKIEVVRDYDDFDDITGDDEDDMTGGVSSTGTTKQKINVD